MAPSLSRLLRRPWWRRRATELAAAGPPWLLARGAVLLGWIVAAIASDKLVAGGRPIQVHEGLFSWDASYYRNIAEHGYDGVDEPGLRFFPLVPLLARAVAVPLAGNVGAALVLVTASAALVAGMLLHRLALEETGDQALATRAAWLIALLPPALTLVLAYAESVLLLTAVATFLALRRGRWWWAAGAGYLAGLARPVGTLLALPALIETARDVRRSSPRQLPGRIAAVVAPVAGTLTYLVWVGATRESWLQPIRLQSTEDLRGGWRNPLATVLDAIGSLLGDGRLREGLHAPWLLLFLVLLVVVARRWPVSYTVYAGAIVLLALSAQSLGSFERYALSAFPLVLALATITTHRTLAWGALAATGAGLSAFAALAFLGTFVP